MRLKIELDPMGLIVHGFKQNKIVNMHRYSKTYSEIVAQIASAARSKISLLSIKIKSHTRNTQLFGKHVQKSVKNHCMVNTFIRGGSIESIQMNENFT